MKLYKRLPCNHSTRAIKVSHHGALIITLHDHSTLYVWDTTTFQLVTIFTSHLAIRDYALSFDASQIAIVTATDNPSQSAARSAYAHIYTLPSLSLIATYPLADVRSALFFPDNRIAFGCLGDRDSSQDLHYIDIFNPSLTVCEQRIELPHLEAPFQLSMLPDRKILLSLGLGIVAFDLSTFALVQHLHSENIRVDWDIWETTSFYALPTKNLVAVGFDTYYGQYGFRVCLFDAKSWQILGWYVHDKRFPSSVALSPDGQSLATILEGHQVAQVWSIPDARLVGECDIQGEGHVAFTADNQYLIVGANTPHALTLWER